MVDFTWWQVAAFFGPSVVTLIVWVFHKLSGSKTNINATLLAVLGATEMLDMSFLPYGITAPLATGFAAAIMLSNTVLSSTRPNLPKALTG